MDKELKAAADAAVEPVMRAVEALKAAHDKEIAEIKAKGVADPTTLAEIKKINETLDKFEPLNAKVTAAEAEAKKVAEKLTSMDDSLAKLEAKVGRPGAGDPEQRKIELKAKANLWLRGVVNAMTVGVPNLPDDQRKALADAEQENKSLSISNDTTGGYLALPDYVREIIKGVTEISPVRQLVRVRSTANHSLKQPKRNGQFAGAWVAEQGTRSETTGLTWSMEEIFTHEMYALIDISQQNLEDSAFNLEDEVRMEAVEQFALLEGTAVVSGSGVGRPEGWQTNTSVSSTNSGNATTISADGMIELKHAIKTEYTRNANWVMNRTTMGSVRKLKTGDGQYLWMPGIAMGKPNTIDGDPYVECTDMPSEGAGLFPIAYGDFSRAYTMVDRIAMSMLRDPFTQATSGNIRFLFRRRVGGQVVLAEAVRKLKCSA